MKKIATLLIAALFGLSAALPVTAVAAEDSMAIVPATSAAKPAKVKKAKKAKKAKKKPVRAARKHMHRH
ncbi:MAG: hypothetical protein KGZ83_15745 [Sulfuricella sp.]|nr:hypothetical protein [Sulfuricella sp.]